MLFLFIYLILVYCMEFGMYQVVIYFALLAIATSESEWTRNPL